MMATRYVGISIHDDGLSGVVIEQHGKRVRLLSCLRLPCNDFGQEGERITDLLERLEIGKGHVFCSLPLSMLSVRNLEFPFTDGKKIGQVLPLELDEQLPAPIDTLVSDHKIIQSVDGQSSVLAFAGEKEVLRRLLKQMAEGKADPTRVMPSAVAVVEAVGRRYDRGRHLLLHTDSSSLVIAILDEGACRFCRRVPYPEEVILNPPFVFSDNIMKIVDIEAAEDCMRRVGGAVNRSLGFLRMQGVQVDALKQAVVTGVMAYSDSMCSIIGSGLGLEVVPERIPDLLDIEMSDEIFAKMEGGRFETATAVAHQGVASLSEFNLRQGEFAGRRKLLLSKKQWGAAALVTLALLTIPLGYYMYDAGRLREHDQSLRSEMLRVYRSRFPHAQRIQDPYVQMKVALRDIEVSEQSMPMYSGRKRNLDYLADISMRIPPSLPIRVSRLVVDTKAVRVRGITENFNRVDEIKNRLAASPLYSSVQILSATADTKTNKIRFELQLLPGDV